MMTYIPSEAALEKIEQIKEEAKRYACMHRKMPSSIALTKEEVELVKEARKAGIIPEILFKGKKQPVNIRYGGYRYG